MIYLLKSILKCKNNITGKGSNETETRFVGQLNCAFNNILLHTKTPSVVSTIFEVSEKFSDQIMIDSALINEGKKFFTKH